ncbi:MAG: ABC transporter permease [Planctomycetota bacterium]|nr:ABC transporter permease [Planctomycetota bacterium]
MPLWQLAINSLAGRRLRSGLLVSAVALAAALSIAVASLVGTVASSVRLSLSRMAGMADLEVRHGYGGRVDDALLTTIRAWPETLLASGRLDVGVALEGDSPERRMNHLAVGVDPEAYQVLQPQKITDGRWIRGPGEIAVDQRIARFAHLKPGDVVTLSTARSGDLISGMADMMLGKKAAADVGDNPGGPRKFTVVGLISRPSLDVLQRPTGYITFEEARGLAGLPSKMDRVFIQLKPGLKAEAATAAHAKAMPPGVEIHTLAAATSGVDRALRTVRIMLLLLTLIVFTSAGFIIVTGLTTAVTERARELGILRCVGASRAQVAGAQLLAGAMLAGAGSLLGAPLGMGIAYLFYRRHAEALTAGFCPDWISVAVAGGVALLTGLLAAGYPAWRAASVQPLEALASRALRPSARGILLCLVLGLLLVGVEPILLQLPLDPQVAFWVYVGFGLPLLFTGFFLLSVPVLVALAAVFAWPLSLALRLPAALLRQSVSATPYRHGFTGAALMLGLAMLVGIWTGGRSALGDWFTRIEMPDAFVHSFFALSEPQWQAVRKVEGVAMACPTTMFPVEALGQNFGVDKLAEGRTLLVSLEPTAFLSMMQILWVEGDPATAAKRLEQGRAVLVSREYKVAHGLGLGSHIALNTPAQGPVDFEIVGVVASPGLEVAVQFFGIQRYYSDAAVASVFASRADARELFGNDSVNLILLKFAKGADEEKVMAAIRRKVPGVIVGSSSSIRWLVLAVAKGLMEVASSLALATLFIACFGVGNLILANISARQFEYGVLRAAGATRGLLGRLIAAEALLVALTGCTVGTALGLTLAMIDKTFHARLLGLSYAMTIPWDVIAFGWATVVLLALLAAIPGIVRLALTHPRTLLAGE